MYIPYYEICHSDVNIIYIPYTSTFASVDKDKWEDVSASIDMYICKCETLQASWGGLCLYASSCRDCRGISLKSIRDPFRIFLHQTFLGTARNYVTLKRLAELLVMILDRANHDQKASL